MIEDRQEGEKRVAGDNGALPDQQTAAGLADRILMEMVSNEADEDDKGEVLRY